MTFIPLLLAAAVQTSAIKPSALTVTTQSTAPSSLPKGATRVPLLSVAMQASCDGNVQVSSLTLTHSGISDAMDVRNVYGLSGLQRITRSGHMDRNGTATIRFMKPLTLKACSMQSIVIAADFTADAASGGEHAVIIRSKDDVQTTATTVTLLSSARSNAAVAGASGGTVTVKYLPLHGILRYGATETLARLQLTAGGRSDAIIRGITLTNEGTARDTNFSDLFMESSAGDILTDVAPHLDGTAVHLVFAPGYILRRGDTKTIVLKGRVTGSTLKTVRFLLQEESDLLTSDVHVR